MEKLELEKRLKELYAERKEIRDQYDDLEFGNEIKRRLWEDLADVEDQIRRVAWKLRELDAIEQAKTEKLEQHAAYRNNSNFGLF